MPSIVFPRSTNAEGVINFNSTKVVLDSTPNVIITRFKRKHILNGENGAAEVVAIWLSSTI